MLPALSCAYSYKILGLYFRWEKGFMSPRTHLIIRPLMLCILINLLNSAVKVSIGHVQIFVRGQLTMEREEFPLYIPLLLRNRPKIYFLPYKTSCVCVKMHVCLFTANYVFFVLNCQKCFSCLLKGVQMYT